MRRLLGTTLVMLVVCGLGGTAHSAGDSDAKAVIDKAIQALGGEANLGKAKVIVWKSKGKFHFGGNESDFTGQTTIAGLNRFRQEFESEVNGDPIKGVTVLDGDKGWREIGDISMEFDSGGVANEKRSVYLQVVPATLLPLKGNDFQIEAAGEEKVGDADAVVIKVTAPDGKDFKLYFDKTSGLPAKLVANVKGFMGGEYTQETSYGNYKDFGGVKKATKIETRRDGEKLVEAEITDFKLLEKVDPETFAEPKSVTGDEKITAALAPFVESHSLAGAVTLVADKDRTLSLVAVGYADVAADKPMRTDALFWIASQTKSITAAALMMLVDEGKIALDDPVEKYLPEFKDQWLAVEADQEHVLLKKPKHPITVRTILSHTSGMPFKSRMEEPTLDTLALGEAVRSYAMTPLQSEPGTQYQYSNAGINTAGRIIEVVSGKSYEDFLDERLFRPLGMIDTTFRPKGRQLERLAKSYKPDADKTGLEETTITQLKYPLDDRRRQPVPAGGLFSTAADLARFCQMVLGGGQLDGKRFLSEAAVKQMTTKQTGDAIKDGYGLGWSTGGGGFGHGGAYSTNMTIDPARGRITVFLVQHAGFPGNGNEAQGAFRKAADDL
ncbi:MAG TPA: serine hydrolase domain-containing protein [Pirellulales bacterium]|nr:serine hydrolase domain-containing protein [Pirellulales bacterium]